MKKYKLLSLLLILSVLICVFPVQALALDEPEVSATSIVVMNTDSGDILYEKNGDQVISPTIFSTLMSAIIVGEALDNQSISANDAITASENIRYNMRDDTASVGIVPGEVMTVEDLLYCSILAAARDSWNMLAEYTAGSIDEFVAAMNDKASELGCSSNTKFVNANGQDTKGQTSTARDLAIITRALTKVASVQTAYGTVSYSMPATNMSDARTVYSTNALINPDNAGYYSYAYGYRNDFVQNVGYAVVGAATYNDMDLIAVVIGSPDGDSRYADARTLFDWAFANFGYRTLVSSTDVLGTLPVTMGNPSTVSVSPSESLRVVMPEDQDLSGLEMDIEYDHEKAGRELEAPIAVGEHLGDVTVTLDGEVVGTARLVAATAVDISRVEYLRNQLQVLMQNQSVRQIVSILLGALGVYLLLVVVYTVQRFLHLHSLRKARKARAAARAQQEIGWLDLPTGEQEEYAPAADGQDYEEAPADEDEEYYEEEAPAEEDGEDHEDEDQPAAEDGEDYEEEAPAEDDEYYEEEAPAEDDEYYEEAPAEDGEYYDDEAPADGEYYDDEGGYYDDGQYYDEDEYYDDEDPGEPPAEPKRHWWKRK